VIAREKAGHVILERLKSVHNADGGRASALLAGDFNLTKDTAVGSVWQAFHSMGFQDALTCVDCVALQKCSFHGFQGGPFTQCACNTGHMSHIDWIFSRSTDQLTFSRSKQQW